MLNADQALREAHYVVLQGLRVDLESVPPSVVYAKPYTDIDNLIWMVETAMEQIDTFPLDKIARWVGFVQGVMAARGYLSVEEERNRTRPIFHKAYAASGIEIPASRERQT